MVRACLLVLSLLLGSTVLGAQDLGRFDRLWREYLHQTVLRGLPLVATDPDLGVVPFWPALAQARAEAFTLEPGADVALISAWIDRHESVGGRASAPLLDVWPRPALTYLSQRLWGDSLFTFWDPASDPQRWINAWLAWESKAYSPVSLVRGIEVLEHVDPSAVGPLLMQAMELYPDDRRFLPLLARHPEVAPTEGLLARDLRLSGGWTSSSLRRLLDRSPETLGLLTRVGYSPARLDAAQVGDYGPWLASKQPLTDGPWTWDADGDGVAENRLIVQNGSLVTWSRRSVEGSLWTLGFKSGKPDTLTEIQGGATWILRYEDYPLIQTLEYRWAATSLIFRFRPLTQSIPLWPAERFQASLDRLPAALADLWTPLDSPTLAKAASSVETWKGGTKVQTVFLFRGEVWLNIEDTNSDGRDDTWSYYRSGRLDSVYRDFEGQGRATLREIYVKGELAQVQSQTITGNRVEFALFPTEGVQLWDFHGNSRPLDRIFTWSGRDKLEALVFSGASLPWETMPLWEPRP